MLRIYLLFITLLVSFSALAETDQSDLSLPFANTIRLNECVQVNILDDNFVLVQSSDAKNVSGSEQPTSENKSKLIDSAQPIQINQLNNKPQPSPEYVLIYELLIEKINAFANLESVLAQTPKPWFMDYAHSSARLSGWKDTNSQYASKITYHLS